MIPIPPHPHLGLGWQTWFFHEVLHITFNSSQNFLGENFFYPTPFYCSCGGLATILFLCRSGHFIQFLVKKLFSLNIDPLPSNYGLGLVNMTSVQFMIFLQFLAKYSFTRLASHFHPYGDWAPWSCCINDTSHPPGALWTIPHICRNRPNCGPMTFVKPPIYGGLCKAASMINRKKTKICICVYLSEKPLWGLCIDPLAPKGLMKIPLYAALQSPLKHIEALWSVLYTGLCAHTDAHFSLISTVT